MSDYDTDILTWSEHQAALLHRIARGELVNSAELDWPNIAEEIDSVGRSELRACEGLLRQALLHMLKAEAWPLSQAAPGRQAEAIRFRQEAADAFSPSMRQRIDFSASNVRSRRASDTSLAMLGSRAYLGPDSSLAGGEP